MLIKEELEYGVTTTTGFLSRLFTTVRMHDAERYEQTVEKEAAIP